MRNPDFTKPFILQIDAFRMGAGTVLSKGEDVNQPIEYFSRKLLLRERNYSDIEKECQVILLGVKPSKLAYLANHSLFRQITELSNG